MEEIYGVTISETGAPLPCIALVGKLDAAMNDMVSFLVKLVKDKIELAGAEDSLRMFLDNNAKADILQVLSKNFAEVSSTATWKRGEYSCQTTINDRGNVFSAIKIATDDGEAAEYHVDVVDWK